MPTNPRNQYRYYLFSQCIGWGLFLILRVVFSWIYCAKHPEINRTEVLFWECVDHLGQAFSSHLIWVWMHKRKLFDRGWKKLVLEGYLLALALSFVSTLIVWVPCRHIYSEDLARLGPVVMYAFILMQHVLVTVLWFSGLIALYYFHRARTLEVEQAEATAAAREAQLNALKGQINPHFLFNSFNSLRALIDVNPALARDAVTHLAVIMRYSLTGADRKLVSLSEELKVVGLFLELEKLRLGERLKVSAEIEEGLDTVQIPPLMLQGLMENAVKFGPAAKKSGGEIFYSVKSQSGKLRLQVSNPGRLGMPSDSTGTGLKNLRDRLALLYGDQASFSIREEGDRVVAELMVPAVRVSNS